MAYALMALISTPPTTCFNSQVNSWVVLSNGVVFFPQNWNPPPPVVWNQTRADPVTLCPFLGQGLRPQRSSSCPDARKPTSHVATVISGVSNRRNKRLKVDNRRESIKDTQCQFWGTEHVLLANFIPSISQLLYTGPLLLHCATLKSNVHKSKREKKGKQRHGHACPNSAQQRPRVTCSFGDFRSKFYPSTSE